MMIGVWLKVGGCRVINQHNECRWGLCRWSPHSGLCHPAGSLFAPLQCLCTALTVCLRHVLPASLFNLRNHFSMILFYNQLFIRMVCGVYNQWHFHLKILPLLVKWNLKMPCTVRKQKNVCCCKNPGANRDVCQTQMQELCFQFFFFLHEKQKTS